MHELKLMDVQKKYKDKEAVRKFNYTFTNGVYGLLGENGAGKTTLMRLICGVLQPTGGSIYCDNIEIASMGAEYRRLLGYLPQEFGYYGDFTAERFLRYMAALKALPEDYADSRIDELLDMVELKNVKKKKLKTFSGGMIRRIGIAQALLNNPEILILDEPTSGLDPLMQMKFIELMKKAKQQGKTVFMSSHIFEEIENVCNRVVIIKEGQVVAIEDMEHLKHHRYKHYEIQFHSLLEMEKFMYQHPDAKRHQQTVSLLVKGSPDQLIKELSSYTIDDFNVQPQSLEEIFLQYYGE